MTAAAVAMIAATVVGKSSGTAAAFKMVYHSWWFVLLWVLAVLSGLASVILEGRRLSEKMLHCSFALILCGALVTFFFGETGVVHLRKGESVNVWTRDDGREVMFPFVLELKDFEVERYAGSMAESDYRSTVAVDGEESVVSMNKILKSSGFRLYQSGYDEDMAGTFLTVSHDPWGVGVTYAGYLAVLLSLAWHFFGKGSRFGETLKRVGTAFVLALLFTVPSKASGELPKVLPDSVAARFGELYVYYNDRIVPMETLTRDYCLKAYGKAHWRGFPSDQVVSGWLFFYDWWKVVPFKLKASERGTSKESEKEQVLMQAASGRAFKIFPLEVEGEIRWFGCDDPLPEGLDYDKWVFVRRVLDVVHDGVKREDWDGVSALLGKIREYQVKTAGAVLPSDGHVAAERLYNRISRPMVPFMAAISLGLLVFVMSAFLMARGRRFPLWLDRLMTGLAVALLAYLTLVLGLRWYVSGHAPFAGSYSVMLVMAWLAALAMILLRRRFVLVLPLGFVLAGFTMLVASLASANPQITHIMPVLHSPLLSVHVLSMMLSYTLFALVALNGVMGLLARPAMERLRDVSLVVLYPAVFLLAFGTILGSVWANISWGSYWAWDPKETWALVTLLVYAGVLKYGVSGRPVLFHVLCIVAFLSVLVTYFGVNMVLGGMHSYA
ncbi:MAG: cytochrome c biogenesis protein CcsA [Bacteroidales bacterium]|nr:cytochrome c biogenesis protein CcsA [Bacteroidales bacterium]